MRERRPQREEAGRMCSTHWEGRGGQDRSEEGDFCRARAEKNAGQVPAICGGGRPRRQPWSAPDRRAGGHPRYLRVFLGSGRGVSSNGNTEQLTAKHLLCAWPASVLCVTATHLRPRGTQASQVPHVAGEMTRGSQRPNSRRAV